MTLSEQAAVHMTLSEQAAAHMTLSEQAAAHMILLEQTVVHMPRRNGRLCTILLHRAIGTDFI